jgi:hypothetical protein
MTDMLTVQVPIVHSGPIYDLDREPDEWVTVPARNSGVQGILVTAVIEYGEPTSNWTLTHRSTGRSLGPREYPSIAAARRAAKRVGPLLDWTEGAEIIETVRNIDRALGEKIVAALRDD